MTDPRTNNALRPHLSRPLFAHFETFFNGHANVYIGARGRGAWRVTVNRATFVAASDFDGDGTGDVAIGSPWGIGTLEKSGGSFTALALKPNGSRFDGWLLNTNDNRLEIVADLNGDGKSEMVFASPWGIGLLRLAGTDLRRLYASPQRDTLRGVAAQHRGQQVRPRRRFRRRREEPSFWSPAPGASVSSSSTARPSPSR